MRSGNASQYERVLRVFERHVTSAIEAQLCRVRVEDRTLSGESLIVDGKRLINFGSCAYLGLNLDARLKDGAIRAIERFGPVFSSSPAYTSVDLYTELEDRLSLIFDASVVVPTTTTLGHLAALPVLIGQGDIVLVDAQAHSTVHLATQVVQSKGIEVRVLPHNDLAALDAALDDLTPQHAAVWYLADGVYSMLGDVAPVTEIVNRLDRYPNMHVYFDDAHGFGWKGLHGRGYVLDQTALHERMIVAVSLSKAFGSGGAAIAFPDEETARRVQLLGGTLTFSGPMHPAELGAAVASSDIALSPEHQEMQYRLHRQIDDVRRVALELELPIPTADRTPIWFAKIGSHDAAIAVARRLMADGFYVNLASFPAVAMGQSGLRFTHTLYHDTAMITTMMEAMAGHIEDVVGVVERASHVEILVDLSDSAMTQSLESAHD